MTPPTELSPVSRRATLADVARAASVSTSTASVVFSGRTKVSDATRERVLAAAADLGYSGPDPRAASLRRGRSGIVAVVLEGQLRAAFLDPVTIPMMDGLTDGLASLGAGVLLLRDEPGRGCLRVDDGTGRRCRADRLLRTSPRVAGDRAQQRSPSRRDRRRRGEGIPRITLNNREAAAEIATHVQQLGHTDVAVVTLPPGSDRARGLITSERLAHATVDVTVERLAGVRDVYPNVPAIAAKASSIDEGLIAGHELLADPRTRPTAILAQSDLLAAGVIRAAEDLGLRVPDDVSVAGFDGIRVDGIGPHMLTTMVQPAVEKGRAAGEQVARMLRGEPAASLHFTCRFRAGSTTAAPGA